MASHDELISRFWDELLRSGQPAAEPELDSGLTAAIERFQLRYAVSPPGATRERVRQRVLQSQSTAHEMEDAMNLDAATLPLPNANGRTLPIPIPQRPSAPRGRWIASHQLLARLAAAAILILALLAGIVLFSDQGEQGHPAVAPASPSPAEVSTASWLQYGNGPAHTGVATSDGPAGTPFDLWTFATQGGINSAPAIADGVLYIGSRDGYLYAIDDQTGDQQWAFNAGVAVDSSPAIGDGLVYAVDAFAVLHAIDVSTGAETWKFSPANDLAQPMLADGVLYIAGGDGKLYALDPSTGDVQWTFETNGPTGRTSAYADGVVYQGNESGQLFAIDAATGMQQWVYAGGSGTAASTVVANGMLFQSFIYGAEESLVGLDAKTGAELWRFATPSGVTIWVPSTDGDTVYVPSDDGYVYALESSNGAVRWQFEMDGSGEAPGTIDSSAFYVVDTSGALYALDLNTGAERWRLPIAGGATKGPSLVDGVLYLGTSLGVVHALAEPPEDAIPAPGSPAAPAASPVVDPGPQLVWSLDAAEAGFSQPGGITVDPDGHLWVFDGSDTITILGDDGQVIDTWQDGFDFTQDDGRVYGNALFAESGDIFVLDTGSNRILKFDTTRTLLTAWGGFGDEDGQFRSVTAIALTPDGNILAADDDQRRIQEFSPDGAFLASWPVDGDIADIAVDPKGRIYLGSGCELVVWDAKGNELDRWAVSDSMNCQLVSSVEIQDDGNIFVSAAIAPHDPDAHAIIVFDRIGNALASGNLRVDPSDMADVDDAIVLDGRGHIYVLDYFANTIAKYALEAPTVPVATPTV